MCLPRNLTSKARTKATRQQHSKHKTQWHKRIQTPTKRHVKAICNRIVPKKSHVAKYCCCHSFATTQRNIKIERCACHDKMTIQHMISHQNSFSPGREFATAHPTQNVIHQFHKLTISLQLPYQTRFETMKCMKCCTCYASWHTLMRSPRTY